jgi:hypothetical protein
MTISAGYAQKPIDVSQQKVSMSKGENPAYVSIIPEANYENTVKNWKKLIRQNTKNKVREENHEIVIEGTQIPIVSEDLLTIYSAIIQMDSSLKLIALFEIDSVFYDFESSSKSVKDEKLNSQILHFIRNFSVEQYLFAVEAELEQENSKLQTLNKELSKLTKEHETLLKEISENEQNIKNSEDAITGYELENTRKLEEIDAKKQSIASIGEDAALRDQAEKQLKDLEKEKKGIESALDKENKNIIKFNSEIESLNLQVERNKELQALKMEEINKQENVVEKVKAELHSIK